MIPNPNIVVSNSYSWKKISLYRTERSKIRLHVQSGLILIYTVCKRSLGVAPCSLGVDLEREKNRGKKHGEKSIIMR